MTTDPRPAAPEPAMQGLVTRLRGMAGAQNLSIIQGQWVTDAIYEIERRDQQLSESVTIETEYMQEIQRLQRALAFWLPGVPADDPQIAQRAGDDAALLAGYDDDEPDAEERGWISLRKAP